MKKILLSFAVLCAVSAQAQVFVGGTGRLGYLEDTFVFSAVPEVGYEFNERWAVGGALGFSLAADGDTTTFGVAEPFIRFTPWRNERVAFDIKACGEFMFKDFLAESEIGLRPSVRFFLNGHFDVSADFGILGASYNGLEWKPAFLVTGPNVSLGVAYTF